MNTPVTAINKTNSAAMTAESRDARSPTSAEDISDAVSQNDQGAFVNEHDFFDQHNVYCEVCNQPGEVLGCATWNLVFHMDCVLPPNLIEEPPDDWHCAYCWREDTTGGKNDGKEQRKAANACREMESKRGLRVKNNPEENHSRAQRINALVGG
jgi:hypothetical protein